MVFFKVILITEFHIFFPFFLPFFLVINQFHEHAHTVHVQFSLHNDAKTQVTSETMAVV